MAQSRRLYCTVARSKTAVAGLLLVLFFCCDARPSSATAACYVDLVLAAGATACVSGTYKYRENPTGSAWITYPTAPLFCQSAGVGGNPAALQGGTVRVTFPRVDGSCSFGGATVVSARNKALAAAVAQASLSTAVPREYPLRLMGGTGGRGEYGGRGPCFLAARDLPCAVLLSNEGRVPAAPPPKKTTLLPTSPSPLTYTQ